MNVIVLSLALGGHYLRLNMRTIAWMLLVTLGLALIWESLSEALLRLALLPLFLPFNFALPGSVAFFGWLHRRGLRDERVPIDWTSTTPAEIRALSVQKEKADPVQTQAKTERSFQLPPKVNLKVYAE